MIKLTQYQLNSMVGGTFNHQGAVIKISPGILTDQEGKLYNGSSIVKVGYLNASIQGHQRSMPGGYAGYLADGSFSTF